MLGNEERKVNARRAYATLTWTTWSSIMKVAVRIGKAATINKFAVRAVQQNAGMRKYIMPGARNFRIVATKLIPVPAGAREIADDERQIDQ